MSGALTPGGTPGAAGAAGPAGPAPSGSAGDIVTLASSGVAQASSPAATRTLLGLGAAAQLAVGVTTGTVAAGDDARITGAVQTSRTIAGLSLAADRSVSDVRVALGTQTVDGLTSSTGWSLTNGNGTAAISGGSVTLTTGSGADTTTPNRVSATRALGVQAAHGVDVSVRLASFTGTLGTVRALLNVSNKSDGANATYGTGDYGVSLGVNNTSGGIFGGEFMNSSTFTSRVATTAGIVAFDGTSWLRIVLTAHGYALYTGVGATFAAAVWTRRASYVVDSSPATDSAIALAEPLNVTLAGYRNGSQAQAHVVTFSDLRIVGW